MKASCLVNNFNYRQFVTDAVDSVLAQTVPFDEIIVVDDGSTDGSLDRLRQTYGGNPRVQVIGQRNGGQLSCFNTAFAAAKGDLICFLDADDVYEPDYLEQLRSTYAAHPEVDFVFTSCRQFGAVTQARAAAGPDRDFGYSVILTLCRRQWIGAPTSCLSLRRALLARILPIPFLDDWRQRADDCLVFGASLAGGRKLHLARQLVRYRVHARNGFCGTRPDRFQTYQRKLAINRLFSHLLGKNGLDPQRLPEFAHREFHTLERPTWTQLCHYTSAAFRARVRLSRKLAIVASMLGYYFFGRAC
jgi:glycosyltransferase involved in cell wall biosynthesis